MESQTLITVFELNFSKVKKSETLPMDLFPKPIFLVTHPRAISTAFERVFLTRESEFVCVHEPFSDAYHWGPEKLSERYEDVEKLRAENGFEYYTYRTALKIINDAKAQGKRVFVKDMAKCLMPLPGEMPCPVRSLRRLHKTKFQREELINIPNPTVLPSIVLTTFHFTFLIRNPQQSIPSLYECTVPPKSHTTGWHGFKASDAGYKELRKLFDYLVLIGQIGPEICLVDADDILAYPEETVQSFCESIGIPFDCDSLQWGTERHQQRASNVFKNWAPFHDTVLQSTSLKAHPPKVTTPEIDMAKWMQKYGNDAAELIRQNVEDNMEDYLYLKQFAIRPKQQEMVELKL